MFKNTRALLKLIFARRTWPRGRVLFVGQSYYHAWYLSRELRKLGWAADLVNIDTSPASAMYYHGQDFQFEDANRSSRWDQVTFYCLSLIWYQCFVFSNMEGMVFGNAVPTLLRRYGKGAEIKLLKVFGKKIVYANNGCHDGVSQSSFRKWGPVEVCSSCIWRDRPEVCSDERNLAWGAFRNALADYQCTIGGNRADYNNDPSVHEVPWFYCNDKELLRPGLDIPDRYHLNLKTSTLKLYHAVGNYDTRVGANRETVKSTHIYFPLIERLRAEGYDIELIFCTDIPNTEVRFVQAQADIFLDMLTYGFFGANIREAMLLGKPAICFLRPEWLASMRAEIPDYVDELPVVSATPDTVYEVLKDLLDHPEKRDEIGQKARAFALKWHASDAAAKHFDVLLRDIIRKEAA